MTFQMPGIGAQIPNALLWKETRTIARELCLSAFGANEGLFIHPTSLCIYHRPGHGVCRGDTGGPLVTLKGVLVGIASWGTCTSNHPDIFVRIFPFVPYIRTVSGMQ